ncbi:MAG: esterase family protein [Clostridia bacterium]|nr:esterase family protein [Clostridia bacterium]
MFLQLNLNSKQLGKKTQVNILLPNKNKNPDRPYKVLWLLHGLGGDNNSWMRNTGIERYVTKLQLAVIMPNVDRSWYANTSYGMNYFNYITNELPQLCYSTLKCLSEKREDNIIVGLSMGGYGALKAALTYPDRYGFCASLSGALDVTRKKKSCNLDEWRSLFGFNIESPLELEGGENDLFALANQCKKEDKTFPEIYMWCGLQDALLQENHEFEQLLAELDVPHIYKESKGGHSWTCWDIQIQDVLKWIFKDPTCI